MRSPARARRGWLVVAGLLVVAACSGDDPAASPAEDEPTTTTATEDTTPRPSPGCGSSEAEPAREVERTLAVRGVDRRYLLTTPPAHDGSTPLPVVLDFHGFMEGADIHTRMSEWSTVAEEEGVVAVFPHGTGEPVRWNVDIGDPTANDDLAYVDAVLAEVFADLCVDERRVYATGLSMGAMMSSALACERADVFAAIAPVAGITDHPGCDPARPVPVIAYHGTDDAILLFNGGVDASALPGGGGSTTTAPPPDLDGPGYPAAVAAFAERNGCAADPADADLTDEVLQRTFDCPAGADVEFLVIDGGGHSWPGSDFSASIESVVGPTTFDVDATRGSWAFLSRFRLP